MAKQVAFNTRRYYSDKGQRIAVASVKVGIYFIDFDRGIDGFLACDNADELTPRDLARTTMFLYDRGCYRSPDVADHLGRGWIHDTRLFGYDSFAALDEVHVLQHYFE